MTYIVLCAYGPERHNYKIVECKTTLMPNEMMDYLTLKLRGEDRLFRTPKLEVIGVGA